MDGWMYVQADEQTNGCIENFLHAVNPCWFIRYLWYIKANNYNKYKDSVRSKEKYKVIDNLNVLVKKE